MTQSVRITDAQLTALQCAGVFELNDELASHIERDRVRVSDRSRNLVNDLSNHLDVISREEPDPDRRKWYANDSRVLSNLLMKMYSK